LDIYFSVTVNSTAVGLRRNDNAVFFKSDYCKLAFVFMKSRTLQILFQVTTLLCSAKQNRTRSTGTPHTSAKARLTSVAIWIRQNLIVCSSAHS